MTATKAKTKAELEAELADVLVANEHLQRQLENAEKAAPAESRDEPPTVFEAWSRVMADVQAVSKDSRNQQQQFNFRGIDAVMNAVGPVLRKHGVIVVPTALDERDERYETKSKAQMCNRVVKVSYTVYGPAGDMFFGSSFGEAADSGDKAMAKAMSVAYRTFLLQSLTIPTDEPDPDAESHDRVQPEKDRQGPAPQERKTPADLARDELRELATKERWDLLKVADSFSAKFKGDLKTASAEDVRAFKSLLESGAVSL